MIPENRTMRLVLTVLLMTSMLGCRFFDRDRQEPGKPATRRADAKVEAKPTAKPEAKPDPRDDDARPRGVVDPNKPQTIVFVVMDTVRAASTSLCGYDRPTTPFLEKMRDELGAAWTCEAYSPATWTMPSHTSYFTGQTIPEHGHDRLGVKLPEDTAPMLAERLKAQGFQTLMFAANPALARSGLQRGFDRVRIAKDMLELREPAFADELDSELRKADPTRPLFVFVNLIDAHDPYPAIPESVGWAPVQPTIDLHVRANAEDRNYHDFLRGELPPDRAERYVGAIRNAYDYGVSLEDQNVRSVVRLLKKHGRLDGPLRMVVTADHGEFLGEHGLLRHAAYVYEPVVRVPFLFLDNAVTQSRQLPGPFAALSAHQLLLEGTFPEPALPAVSWSRRMDDRPVKPGEDMVARWEAPHAKLLWWNGATTQVDLAADPAEASPAPVDPAALSPEFAAQIEAYRAHLQATAGLATDPETVKALQDLGYME